MSKSKVKFYPVDNGDTVLIKVDKTTIQIDANIRNNDDCYDVMSDLLDELSVKDMTSLIYAGNQGTISVGSISLPATTATDGPAGLKQYGGLGLGVSGNFNCCGALVAATWSVDSAENYGASVGNEAVQARGRRLVCPRR